MSEGMLIRCKKAATPTDHKSAIASPTHLTSPRVRDSQPATAPHLATTGTSIIVQNKEDESEHHEAPDLSTQLERAKRFGHNLSQVNVANKSAHLPTPAYPIAPKMIQCRLTIGQPGDKYEQEADRVAEQVMAMPAPPKPNQIQRQGSEQDEPETLQTKPLAASITPLIQRQAESTEEQDEPETLQTKPLAEQDEEQVQLMATRQQAADGSSQRSSNLENQLKGSKGGGNPLPDSARDFVEPRIGADFRGVRVHTDSTAVQMNRELNAQAFTHGQDIYFGAGKYEPGSSDGKRLLAHELTHVIQQTGAKQIQRQPINGLKSNKETPPSVLDRFAPSLNSPNVPALQLFQESPQTQAAGDNKASPAQKEATPSPAPTQNTQNGGTTPTPAPSNQSGSAVTALASPAVSFASSNAGMREEGQASKTVPQQAVSLNAEDPGQILEQLKNTPPTQASAAYAQAQTASTQALENQRQQVQATIPEIPAPIGLSAQISEPGTGQIAKQAGAAKEAPIEEAVVEKSGQQGLQDRSSGPEAPPEPPVPPTAPGDGNGAEQGQSNPSPASSARFVSLTNKQVSTNAGGSKVDISGESNPSQMDGQKAQSNQQVGAAKAAAASGIDRDFGENNIFPKPSNEILKANKELSKVSPPSDKVGENPIIPGEIVGGLNQALTPYYQQKISPEQQKYQIGKQKFDGDSATARTDANKQIANLNEETQQKQLEQQKQAQQEVAQARHDWQTELDKTEKDYQEKTATATEKHRQKIGEEKNKGEEKADQHLKEAEQKVEAEKKKAEEEAAKKKEEGERKSVGDKIIGFFKDVGSAIVEGIKKAVNFIYEGLRKLVKAIFEAAKQLAMAAIDLARKAIVGIIKAFGEVLKGLVQVVFAAFPGIAKKFTSIIDGAINKATEAVNAVADFLKKAVAAVLDFLAKTLDKLLGLVQDLYKGVLTVIGMLIRGEFAELAKRFGNLIEAAKTMPPQFETAALEELMGGDTNLDKPLSLQELAQAEQAGVNIPGAAGEGSPQTGEATEMPQAPWSEENVGVDAVEDNMELSPEIAAELMEQSNGEGEVMLAESQDESRSMDAIVSEATGEQQVGGQEQQQIPDDGLSPKQRASIKWELMKDGIKQWFSKNWPTLLAALIAAAVVIIGAIVASGGAILAALPMIMEILTIVFAADAIAKIGGYLSDYLSKSWQGDIQAGGKSLAKALAAGAIELIMLLTFEAGKAATKGVKAVAKGTANVARKVSRAVINGVKYIIKKGKVLFKGIAGSGVGKQFKKLGDLGEALLNRIRFKAFRIRVANGRFRLEGLINPWVLIAEGQIKTEINDAGGNIKPVTKETPKATFITDDELKAVNQGGKPKTGNITEHEVVDYHTSTAKGRGATGDDLTGDHIPSRAALVKAEEAALGRKLTPAETAKIKNDGITVVLKDRTHKDLSRTYGGRNTAAQIAEDGKDLGQAFRKDAEAIFKGLHKDKELTPEIVGAYMRAYRENVRKGVFAYSDEAEKIFMEYLNKAKKATPSSGSSPSGVGNGNNRKRPLSSSTPSSSKKPKTN